MPALPPTRSPRCMRCAMMRRKPLGGSIEPGATAIQRSHTSSTTPSSCVTRTICASVRSARKWACRRLQRLESGTESVESPTLRRESVGCERPVCGKLRSRALRPLLARQYPSGRPDLATGWSRPSRDIAVAREQSFGIEEADVEHAISCSGPAVPLQDERIPPTATNYAYPTYGCGLQSKLDAVS